MKNVNKEMIMDMLEKRLDEIIGECQKMEGITSGDVAPWHIYRMETVKEAMSETILDILEWESR